MKFNYFITFTFCRAMQSGGYIDFFYKKLTEKFIRNIFIYMALFFGEKYMIEHWTKKFINNTIFSLNKFFSWTSLSYYWFFLQLLYICLYMMFVLILFLLI